MATQVDIKTIQSNIKAYTRDMTQYSLFMGGLNVKNKAIAQYSPFKTGYARIFFVRMPVFMEKIVPNKTKNFKHLLEYGFVGIDGIQNLTLQTEQITGGYAGRSFDVATNVQDDTNEITVKVYEMAGSPVREYTDLWITGIGDPNSGLAHYHGALDLDPNLEYNQANHTAEAIYVVTDPTGRSAGIEYACLIANMMPKQVKKDHLNYESGQHQVVQTDISFTAVKYESPQINEIAMALFDKFKIIRDYLDFTSGYTKDDVDKMIVPDIKDWPSNATTA